MMDEWQFMEAMGFENLMYQPSDVLNMAVPLDYIPGGHKRFDDWARQK